MIFTGGRQKHLWHFNYPIHNAPGKWFIERREPRKFKWASLGAGGQQPQCYSPLIRETLRAPASSHAATEHHNTFSNKPPVFCNIKARYSRCVLLHTSACLRLTSMFIGAPAPKPPNASFPQQMIFLPPSLALPALNCRHSKPCIP